MPSTLHSYRDNLPFKAKLKMPSNPLRWPASLDHLTGSIDDQPAPYPALKYDLHDPRHPYHGKPLMDLLFTIDEKASFSFAHDLSMLIFHINKRFSSPAGDSHYPYNDNIAVALYKAHSHRALDSQKRPWDFCQNYLPELHKARGQLIACDDKRVQNDLLWQLNDIIRRIKDPPMGAKPLAIVPSPKAELERIMNLFEIDRRRRRSLFERARVRDAIDEEIKIIDDDRGFRVRAVMKPKIGRLWADLKKFVKEWPIPYAASPEEGKELARMVLQAYEGE